MKKRDWISITAILGIVILGLVFVWLKKTQVENSPYVYVTSSNAEYGQEGYLTVKAENFDKLAAFDITLEFDKDDVEILEVSKGLLSQDIMSSRENYANTNGKLVLMYVDYTGGDNPLDINNDICYIRYKQKRPRDMKVNISDISFSLPDGSLIPEVRVKGVGDE